KGRLEDLEGWGLFNQEKYADAIPHLKQAAEISPAGTPTWRSALWHLGVALEQSGQKEQALDAYIKSYRAGPPESVHRSVIEQLYRSINGSTNGLDELLATGTAVATTTTTPQPTPTPEATPVNAETTKYETQTSAHATY